jgi:2-hydroxy-3-keto-5-methylthiopentenyl-1-phosphate phosphatase
VKKIKVFCDFDGTITTRDTVDVLLSELASPEWEEIEELWVQGLIGSRECMARQIPLIRGGWAKVRELLDSLQLNPGVAEFVDWCRGNSIPFVVVSDGLDRVIEYLLAKNGIHADQIFANHLSESEQCEFSFSACSQPRLEGCQSGVCKCRIAGQPGDYRAIKVIVGDGRSDFCWARKADLLYARGKLIDYCKSNNLDHNPFDTFYQLGESLAAVSAGRFESVVNTPPIPFVTPATYTFQ